MNATILLVDDEPSVRQLLSDKLAEDGFESRSCSTAEEALDLLKTNSFDLIISDLRLPKMSGIDLLEIVHQSYPQCAFLIVTGVDDIRVGIDAMKRGADDYLVKPFQLEMVVTSITRALERKRLQIEVEDYRQNLARLTLKSVTIRRGKVLLKLGSE